MASITSVRTSIDVNIKTNGQQEITGEVLNSVLNNMVDLSEEAESTLQNHDALLEKYSKELARKANEDGKYPELTAGFANNLVGRGEAVDATINFRASGGKSIEDGAARVKELKGNSVVWNQKIPNGDFRDGLSSWDIQSKIVANVTNGVVEATCSADGDNYIQARNKKFITGHQYLFMGDAKISSANVVCFYIFYGTTSNLLTITSKSTEWESYYRFFKCQGTAYNLVRLQCPKTGVTHQYRNLQLVDLTQMFGEGNEPSTLEEFYSRIPQNVDLYAYNEGEVIHTNAEGIKSVGFNAWDEEWELGSYDYLTGVKESSANGIRCKNFISVFGNTSYYCHNGSYAGRNETIVICYNRHQEYIKYIASGNTFFTTPEDARYITFYTLGTTYNHDICINLSHSGYRNGEYQPYVQFIRDIDSRIREAFPNGMKSAGSAYDEVRWNAKKETWEAVKRIGEVDMGTIAWASATSSNNMYRYDCWQLGIPSPSNASYANSNALTKDFIKVGKAEAGVAESFALGQYGGNYVIVLETLKYSTLDAFKAAMSGVMLYYELSEPIVTELGNDINLDYEVWDFGTEQMLSTEPSAPIKASIVYGFNSVDSIRTAQLEIEALKTQLAQMQTLMASLTAQPAMLEE